MARLDRKHQKIFAGQATDNGVFGSLMAEDPTISNDIEELQSLEAWEKGWNQATVTSADLPPLEEIQGLEYVLSRQQAYIFQEGLAEWNEDTVYYKGSIVKVINGDNFVIYGSLADDNSNAVTDDSSWKVLYDSTKTYVDTVLGDSRYVTVSTDQTVSGKKTFSQEVTIPNPASASDTNIAATTAWVNDKLDAYMQMTNGIYDGVDLTSKFASEIGSDDVWTWLHNRISSTNFNGLHVGDYIPVTISAGTVGSDSVVAQTFNCQVAGIDTYYRYGSPSIGHHIDFISKECCATEVKWNDSNCNNGTSSVNSPWLASKVYGWLNGVNNAGTAYGSNAVGISAEGKGLYQLLPSTLRARIIQKRQLLDDRYSSSGLVDYSSGWDWHDMGYLWLPNEIEVYGTQIRSNVTQQDGWWNPEANIGQTYPLWRVCQKARVKWLATGTYLSRTSWWLSSAADNWTDGACLVGGDGVAGGSYTTRTGVRVPLCFRIG